MLAHRLPTGRGGRRGHGDREPDRRCDAADSSDRRRIAARWRPRPDVVAGRQASRAGIDAWTRAAPPDGSPWRASTARVRSAIARRSTSGSDPQPHHPGPGLQARSRAAAAGLLLGAGLCQCLGLLRARQWPAAALVHRGLGRAGLGQGQRPPFAGRHARGWWPDGSTSCRGLCPTGLWRRLRFRLRNWRLQAPWVRHLLRRHGFVFDRIVAAPHRGL